MKRSEFVLLYINKKGEYRCRACRLYRGPTTPGQCGGLLCAVRPYINTEDTILVTRKECKYPECMILFTERCVFRLKFDIHCPKRQDL